MKTAFKIFLFFVVFGAIYWFAFYQTTEQKEFKKTLAAAQQDDPQAMVLLGDLYLAGKGIESNKEQAIEWYRKAFQKEDSQAAWKLAQVYIQEKNLDEAAAYLQLAAQDKNADAQNELSRFYEEGLGGLPAHKGQAFYWRKKAAQHGDEKASGWLKEIQTQQPDFFTQEEAFFTNLQTAQEGDIHAMVQVAKAYQSGVEVAPDMSIAENWFTKAWEEGKDPQTGYELAQFYLNKENSLSNEEKGVELLAQLAALPYAPAQYTLGERAYQEDPPNYKDAFAWFSNAASNGDAKGQYMTGFMLMQGQGMTRSTALATNFFKQAADQEDASAQYVLGQIYYKGLGVRPNKKLGEEWLKRAAQNGSIPAQAFLESIQK